MGRVSSISLYLIIINVWMNATSRHMTERNQNERNQNDEYYTTDMALAPN